MPIYNFLEYSLNYSDTTGSLCFFSKDKAPNFKVSILNTNNLKSFNDKAKLLGNTVAGGENGILRNTTILYH